MQRHGITADFVVADLTQPNAAAHIYEVCEQRGYVVSSLINNAGIGSGGPFLDISLESELAVMDLNMQALVKMTHLFMTDMKQRKKGRIANIGSMISFMPVPYMAVYSGTKAFVRFFTQAMYEEGRPYGIHVLLFSPGLTETNFMQAAKLDNKSGAALTAGARVQTVDEVATEFMQAYTTKKRFAVSGSFNRFAVRLLALIPNYLIARQSATSYQKKLF